MLVVFLVDTLVFGLPCITSTFIQRYYLGKDVADTGTSGMIAAVILGVICLAVFVYATIVTVLFKRKTRNKGKSNITWSIFLVNVYVVLLKIFSVIILILFWWNIDQASFYNLFFQFIVKHTKRYFNHLFYEICKRLIIILMLIKNTLHVFPSNRTKTSIRHCIAGLTKHKTQCFTFDKKY